MYDVTCTEENELLEELFHAQAEFRVNIKEPGIALLKKKTVSHPLSLQTEKT